MVLSDVQHDAYNRQCKSVNWELSHPLLDGESYLLIADLAPEMGPLPEGASAGIEDVTAQVNSDHEQMEVLMDRETLKWCPKCFLRIAPYDSRTVYNGVDYHQPCFLKFVREQADEDRRRLFLSRARIQNVQQA